MDSWHVKQPESDIDIWGANSHTADDSSAGFHVLCNSICLAITCHIYSVHCVSIVVKRKRGYQI
jgi:hypothetical protein